jgi:hypothetical protein
VPNTLITDSEVDQFIRDWFHKLSEHPALDEMRHFVADDLHINTPDIMNQPFQDWYVDAGEDTYRNQTHTVKALKIKTESNSATVEVVVRWERSEVKSPSPEARLASYAAQRWTLTRSQEATGLRISSLNVDYLLKEEPITDIQPLANAIRNKNHTEASNLITQIDDVNKKDADGFTPLMIAAGLGDREMVELLLEYEADVFITDSRMGMTALHKAAQNKDPDSESVEVAKLLMAKKAFIDAQAPTLGHTPLLNAVWHEHTEMGTYGDGKISAK